jgi:predicted kinase
MHPARCFVVAGLPGSGKTTRATQLVERFGAVAMSADDWMDRLGVDIWDEGTRRQIEMIQGDHAEMLLRGGTSVVVEWGTWTRVDRDRLRLRARRAGALVHLEFLDPPLDVLWDRVRDRAREQVVGTRAISRDDLVTWSEQIERPAAEEFAEYDPMPPVRAGDHPGSPEFPYGSWRPV